MGNLDDDAGTAERPHPLAQIETIPLTAVPPPFRDNDVRVLVRPRAAGASPGDYLQPFANTPQGTDLVAVVTLGILNSPDEAHVQEVRLDDHRLLLHVQVRDFEGRLAANVQSLALALVDVGDLAPGRYDAEIRVDRYAFTAYEHPETATFKQTSSHQRQFEVGT